MARKKPRRNTKSMGETTKMSPRAQFRLPEARCGYGNKIEQTAEFVGRQVGVECNASFACHDRYQERGGVLEIRCKSEQDLKKVKAAFEKENILLKRHYLASRKRTK